MKNIGSKTDGTSSLPAASFNSMCDEMENFVTDAGLTLDAGSETTADPNPTQLSQALYMAARDGDAFTDSGAADAYVLTKIRGKSETAYRNGARFRFVPANTNTGASTVNIQGIGSKNIRFSDNSALIAGAIKSGYPCEIYYDSSADNFKLIGDAPLSPTIQKFTSGSGTYTTPNGVRYIRVRMVGGGGGGGGSGTAGGSSGGTGGSTTFGSSLLSASGGSGGSRWDANSGGNGGSASLGSGPVGTALVGGWGGSGGYVSTSGTYALGGMGGSSFFGGAGGNGVTGGQNGQTNSGGGGGGGGVSGTINAGGGGGGGAGGFVDAIIRAPSASYAYSVGTAGTAGTAGTSGNAGGAGGSGYIEVTEYYS